MSESKMKQWVTTQNSLDSLSIKEVPKPTPGVDEVLVKVNSVSLNFRDTEVCMGVYGHHKSVESSSEIVPGSDMSGVIVDSNGTKWKEGQRVLSIFNQTHLSGQVTAKDLGTGLGLPLDGVLTQYRSFPAESLIAAPNYLTDEEACNLPIATVTAWMAINGFRELGKPAKDIAGKQTVLLQGTGGVSIAGLQIARAAGFRTIITSSSDEKLQKAKDLGAEYCINYKKNPEWEKEVMKITDDAGADIVFETGGAETLQKSFDCVAFGGLINCIGYLSGKQETRSDQLHTNVLALRRNVTIKGLLNGPKDRFEEALKFYAEYEIHPVIDKTFRFEETQDALKYLYSGSHFGKVIVKVV